MAYEERSSMPKILLRSIHVMLQRGPRGPDGLYLVTVDWILKGVSYEM